MTIPIGDSAFAQIAERLLEDRDTKSAAALQARLRSVFPRAVVRARELAGEAPAWYVYRDGGWHADLDGPWWQEPELPRLSTTLDGWIADGNATALGLLGMPPTELGARHLTDFVAPGTLDDSLAILDAVQGGGELTATLRMRPSSGYVIAIDTHIWREEDRIHAVLRLAHEVEVGPLPTAPEPPLLRCRPETDVAFRGYVERSLSRMPEPNADGLAMRLRRLYPRADVTVAEDHWLVTREPDDADDTASGWWTDASLARVRYDAQALIIDANDAARQLLGRELVGHHWQELVIPGSTEQVAAMLQILAEAGRAESRFRMPRADGSLVEFDSFTEVDGETYLTTMRPHA
ncbi:MAG TPA: PAS domain-containing protein [Candidatus Limnocylindria bacterium]|nr:PAS domain-containing protein [Candidatus Limnocylindria bacterium]